MQLQWQEFRWVLRRGQALLRADGLYFQLQSAEVPQQPARHFLRCPRTQSHCRTGPMSQAMTAPDQDEDAAKDRPGARTVPRLQAYSAIHRHEHACK